MDDLSLGGAPAAPQIELRPIDSLVPYARNSRTHSEDQIEKLAAAILEFGFTNSVLADDRGIVAGHGRVMALRRLYEAGHSVAFPNGDPIPAGMVPVVNCAGWSEAKRRAYIIWDNRSAELAGWDVEMLQLEVADLQAAGFDLSLTGFTPDDLAEMFGTLEVPPDERDPDAVPDVPDEPHTKPGDLWICGPHKIICGDSTQHSVWDALMGTELADCVMTDPPYGVSYKAEGKKAIANDDLQGDDLRAFLRDVFVNLFAYLKPGASAYVFHADSEGLAFRQASVDAGFRVAQCLTWVKDSLVLGRSRYQWRHEPCLLLDKPGGKLKWFGGRKQTTVIEYGGPPFERLEDGRYAVKIGDDVLIVDGGASVEVHPSSVIHHPKPKRSDKHPTQKPTDLVAKLLRNSARPNDIVLEAFSGSGSTMMAAEIVGMCCRSVELDPGYVDVAVMRWQAYTGRSAVHAETGEEFPVPPDRCEVF